MTTSREISNTTPPYNEHINIKVSTSLTTLTTEDGHAELDYLSIATIGAQAKTLTRLGITPSITSSGAITSGYALTGEIRTEESRADVANEQRMSCLGQISLINAWRQALAPLLPGQLLATQQELHSDEGTSAKQILERLFAHGNIPILNENDALSNQEIRFGDNDILAAHFMVLVRTLFKRNRLLLLSNVNGVCKDPEDERSVIPVIKADEIDDYRDVIKDTESIVTNGGMASKFDAAKIVTAHGIEMYVANGRTPNIIQKVLRREAGTKFTTN